MWMTYKCLAGALNIPRRMVLRVGSDPLDETISVDLGACLDIRITLSHRLGEGRSSPSVTISTRLSQSITSLAGDHQGLQ